MRSAKLLIIAPAVLLSPLAVNAMPSMNIYGFVDIGLEQYSETGINGGADIFQGGDTPNGNSTDKEFALTNNVQSRIGVKGEEQLDSGWKGSYRMEFRANVLDDGGQALRTRLGWLALSKDEHNITVGSQWSPLFGYSGWNANRGESHGYASYYYILDQLPGSMAYGYRNDSSISYTYGKGPYDDSPFTATVSVQVGDDNRADATGQLYNDSGITGVQAGMAATFGATTLNMAMGKSIVKESDAAKAASVDVTAPSVLMLGGKFKASDKLDFGLAYRSSDRDTGNNSGRYSISGSVQYQLTDAIALHAGMATGEDEDDTQRQLDSDIYGQILHQLSDSRHVRFEFERVNYGQSVVAGSEQDLGHAHVMQFSMRQSF